MFVSKRVTVLGLAFLAVAVLKLLFGQGWLS